jgi:heme exporter protein CcmD
MMGDPHIGFIVAAYAVTAATITAMIGWVLLDARHLKGELAQATRALDGVRGDVKGARE